MAALHSPRYLLARGMHLRDEDVGACAQAASQLDVWGRWARGRRRRDGRGEALLHQALRGVVAGEEAERGRLVGWLCDQGAMLFDGADPIDDDDGDGKKKKGVLDRWARKSMRKMSLPRYARATACALNLRAVSAAPPSSCASLGVARGRRRGSSGGASLLKLIVKQAAAMMSAADLEGGARGGARAVGDAARRRAADARDKLVDMGAALARAIAVTLGARPPPSFRGARTARSTLLTIARVDCGAARGPPPAVADALRVAQ